MTKTLEDTIQAEIVGKPASKLAAPERKSLAMEAAERKMLAKEDQLRDLENKVFERAASTVNDALCFQDIDPLNPDEVPDAWREELGTDERAIARRHRVAKAAWMSVKEAPVALTIAKTVMIGVAKARGLENSGDKVLNVSMVQLPVAPNSYPVLNEDKDD